MDVLNNRSVRKQILLTEASAEKLKKVSAAKNLSQNEIINKALDAYLARFRFKEELQEA